jgi:hypothetical protein
VICSCSALSKAMLAKAESAKLESNETSQQLTCLCTNEKQDVLVGGYETGEVKVWLIHHPSILNLKSPLLQDGLTVPPLQLLAEWSAHVTSIFSGAPHPAFPHSVAHPSLTPSCSGMHHSQRGGLGHSRDLPAHLRT